MQTSQYFAFLSPVPPGSQAPAGTFNPFADPLLEVCRVNGAGCDAVASATLSSQSGSIDLITVDVTNEQYQANWTNLNALPRGEYRISVSARSLNSVAGTPRIFLGSTPVFLTASGGSGLNVSGNTLPIKFRILEGVFCVGQACDEYVVPNSTGGRFILEESASGVGSFGIQFDPNYLCPPDAPDCGAGAVLLTLERYRGPEECIPTNRTGADPRYPSIQWEACVLIRVAPYGVTVQPGKVHVGLCIDPRADTYAASGHLRLMKVKEDQAGNVLPAEIRDLNAAIDPTFFFACDDNFDPAAPNARRADAGAARTPGLLARALQPLRALFGPQPLHARRGKGPFVASLDDFSRIGAVLPVSALFDRDGAVGQPNALLSPSVAPRTRVLAVRRPGSTYGLTGGNRGVQGVAVTFTPDPGDGSVMPATVFTDTDGYAVPNWTLGEPASNPQRLLAQVGYPALAAFSVQNGNFPNPTSPWASYTFSAYVQEFRIFFLSPLGSSGGGTLNLTNVTPSVRVCGPLPNGSTNLPGQPCATVHAVLPAPELTRGGEAWQTSWKTDKNTPDNALYRIDVVINGLNDGSFLVRRGGGGGSDPAGTYQFQTGSNLPIKFTVERYIF